MERIKPLTYLSANPALLTMLLASLIWSPSTSADQCSGQIEGYLRALKFHQTKQSRSEMANIEQQRQRLSDCEIRAEIPLFQTNDAALHNGKMAVRKMKENQ